MPSTTSRVGYKRMRQDGNDHDRTDDDKDQDGPAKPPQGPNGSLSESVTEPNISIRCFVNNCSVSKPNISTLLSVFVNLPHTELY
jgi:hypothetical protein